MADLRRLDRASSSRACCSLLSSFAVWINRVALNTTVFADTSSSLLDDDRRSATPCANRAVDELFANVDVQAEVEAQLPKDLQGSVRARRPPDCGRPRIRSSIARSSSPCSRRLFKASLEEICTGRSCRCSRAAASAVSDARRRGYARSQERSSSRQPTGSGSASRSPTRLPADAGQIVILRADELDTAQNAFELLKTLAWVLPLLTLAAFGLAVWLARSSAERRARHRSHAGRRRPHRPRRSQADAELRGRRARRRSETIARPPNNAWNILTDLMRGSFRLHDHRRAPVSESPRGLPGPGRQPLTTRGWIAPALQNRVWAYLALALVDAPSSALQLGGDRLHAGCCRSRSIAALGGDVDRADASADACASSRMAETRRIVADARARMTDWWESRRAASTAGAAHRRAGCRRRGPPRLARRPALAWRADRRGVRVGQGSRARRRLAAKAGTPPSDAEPPRRGHRTSPEALVVTASSGSLVLVSLRVLAPAIALRSLRAPPGRDGIRRWQPVGARRSASSSADRSIALVALIGAWSVLSDASRRRAGRARLPRLERRARRHRRPRAHHAARQPRLGRAPRVHAAGHARRPDHAIDEPHGHRRRHHAELHGARRPDEGRRIFVPNTRMVSTTLVQPLRRRPAAARRRSTFRCDSAPRSPRPGASRLEAASNVPQGDDLAIYVQIGDDHREDRLAPHRRLRPFDADVSQIASEIRERDGRGARVRRAAPAPRARRPRRRRRTRRSTSGAALASSRRRTRAAACRRTSGLPVSPRWIGKYVPQWIGITSSGLNARGRLGSAASDRDARPRRGPGPSPRSG